MFKRVFILITVLVLFSSLCNLYGQRIQYKTGGDTVTDNTIKPFFKIVNDSSASMALSDFTLRYYYVKEGAADEVLDVYWASCGNANLTKTFAGGYIQYGFGSGAGTLASGASVECNTAIHKSDWSNYDEANDYSFDKTKTAYSDWTAMTLFRNGTLVWGIEPGGVNPVTPEPTAPPAVTDAATPAPTAAITLTPDPTAAIESTPEPVSNVPPAGDDWLVRDGNTIKDSNGKVVRLTGANWFGFNNCQYVFDGLYSCNMKDSLKAIANRGINILRVPMSGNVTKTWRSGNPIKPAQDPSYRNPDLAGLNTLQVFDKAVAYCKEFGLKIMVDFHSAAMDDHAYPLWYKDAYTPTDWIEDLKFVADRYKNDDTILIFDLENEPHGKPWQEVNFAKWDNSTDSNNWKKAAEDAAAAIFSKNPKVLVMVEGIEAFPKDGVTWNSSVESNYYGNWWGGNLRGARDFPINLGTYQNRLVYSPHDYGPLVYNQPWFYTGFDFDTLMKDCWGPNWYYLAGTYPLLIGEWGGTLDGGPNEKWLNAMKTLIVNSRLHHTFWCFNPNSGDTGGLVTGDWVTWDEKKYAILKPTLWQDASGKFIGLDHVVPLGSTATGTSVTAYYAAGGIAPVPVVLWTPDSPEPDVTPVPTEVPTTPPDVTPEPTAVVIIDTPAPTTPPAVTPEPTAPPVVNDFPGASESNPVIVASTDALVDLSNGYCWVAFQKTSIGGMQVNSNGSQFEIRIEYNSGTASKSTALTWSWGPGISGIAIAKVVRLSGATAVRMTAW